MFLPNALLKARTVMEYTGLPSLADDTGLEVAALGGRPGVHTARFAGENATYDDNVDFAKLPPSLQEKAIAQQGGRFQNVEKDLSEQ